jgi:hypothetical protein
METLSLETEFERVDAERVDLQRCPGPATFALKLLGGMTRLQTSRASLEFQELLDEQWRIVCKRNETLRRWAELKLERNEKT